MVLTCFSCGCTSLPKVLATSVGEDSAQEESGEEETAELTILAAASLTDVCTQLKPLYEEKHPGTELTFSFGSSGALQTQIEEGAPADIFFSAATKQMDALREKGLMADESITELLENKIVLVVPEGNEKDLSCFADVMTDKVEMIGLGDPECVPAGQYAQEVFSSLGIWKQVTEKANLGMDVRTVLSWVETGEVDCGVVYATDAYSTEKAAIVAHAPAGTCNRVIYPVGVVKDTQNYDAAVSFLKFLKTDEVLAIFESYGFSRME